MTIEPQTKVIIIQDCRDAQTATGQVGVYEGRFPYSADDPSFNNPRIRLADGSVIFGIECWWATLTDAPDLEIAQAALAFYLNTLKEARP